MEMRNARGAANNNVLTSHKDRGTAPGHKIRALRRQRDRQPVAVLKQSGTFNSSYFERRELSLNKSTKKPRNSQEKEDGHCEPADNVGHQKSPSPNLFFFNFKIPSTHLLKYTKTSSVCLPYSLQEKSTINTIYANIVYANIIY